MKSRLDQITARFSRATAHLAHLIRTVNIEARRLNSARLDSATLASAAPRERRRMVKAALAEHHRMPNRCC